MFNFWLILLIKLDCNQKIEIRVEIITKTQHENKCIKY